MKVMLTGASGCVGRRVHAALAARPEIEIHILLRDPAKWPETLRAVVHPGDVTRLDDHAGWLADMDAVVHMATAWGEAEAYDVAVAAPLALARLAPRAAGRFVVFSSASVLGPDHRPLPEADTLGTDYIRAKRQGWQALRAAHPVATVLFPTIVLAGAEDGPQAPASRGLAGLLPYLWLARHLTLDGSFHFIHARDVARMVDHYLQAPAPGADVVLGNAPVAVGEVLDALCRSAGFPTADEATAGPWPAGRRLDLTALAARLAPLAGRRMSSWDRYCLAQRHFRYDATNPRTLGLEPGFETLDAIFTVEPSYGRYATRRGVE